MPSFTLATDGLELDHVTVALAVEGVKVAVRRNVAPVSRATEVSLRVMESTPPAGVFSSFWEHDSRPRERTAAIAHAKRIIQGFIVVVLVVVVIPAIYKKNGRHLRKVL
jgi:hypothetical protein